MMVNLIYNPRVPRTSISTMLLARLVVCAAVTSAELRVATKTARLSSARRDLGAAGAGGAFYFGGGCNDTQNQFTCDGPSNVVDIIAPDGTSKGYATLSEARGWPAVCVTSTNEVVFAGGGAVQNDAHSPAADVIDQSNKIKSYPTALGTGRWGISCLTLGQHVYFAGGRISGSERKTTNIINVYDSSAKTWSEASQKLSLARESMGATVNGENLIFAGGVAVGVVGQGESKVVDILSSSGTKTVELPSAAYWPGAVTIDSTSYVVGNEKLIQLSDTAVTKSEALPAAISRPSSMTDGGGVPGSHVEANGVAVGHIACFYSYKPSALYCYDTQKGTWSNTPASVMHKGGAIAAVGSTIAVAGGFDEGTSKPTDVIDIFEISF